MILEKDVRPGQSSRAQVALSAGTTAHAPGVGRSGISSRRLRPAPTLISLTDSQYPSVKRLADVVIASLMLVLTAPVLLLVAILVKLTSRGPVLYSQTRLGRHGLPYSIYKIRSMRHECESLTGPCWATPRDPRITPLGRFLRASHLDELPQLWNVLRGDMSLVGPRPERPEFIPQLESAIAGYRDRLLIRPGLTGLAQVQLPPDTDLASVRRKLACDLFYIRDMRFWLDVRIMVATVFYVLHVPFTFTRRMLLVPGGEPVEHYYQALVANVGQDSGVRSQDSGVRSQQSAVSSQHFAC